MEFITPCRGSVALLAVLLSAALISVAPAANQEPVCAVLYDEAAEKVVAPIASILETNLLKEGVTLVERQKIDEILKEQELQTLLAPSAVVGRGAIGKLLKADLLLMLRPEDQPSPRISIVICETKLGLRLCVATVMLSGDVQRDAAAVEPYFKEALGKHQEKVTQIYAVSPFESADLTYESDYLKEAYARLIEQRLLRLQGVVVVETEEAQAVTNEIALSDSPELQRDSPLYFYGDYQHENADAASGKISVHLALRGRVPMPPQAREKMEPDEVPAFLESAVDTLLEPPKATRGGRPARPTDPEPPVAQATRLIVRAEQFEKVGDWAEADGLTEAALLVAPQISEFQRREIVILIPLIDRYSPVAHPQTLESVRRQASYYFRALNHLQMFLHTAPNIRAYDAPDGRNFVTTLLHSTQEWGRMGRPDQNILEELDKNRTRTREVLLNIVRMRARDGRGDELPFFAYAVAGIPRSQQYDIAYQMLGELQDLPGGTGRTYQFATFGYTPDVLCCPEGSAFLDRVINEIHNSDMVSEAKTLRASLPEFAANAQRQREELRQRLKAAPPDPGPQDVSFSSFALPTPESGVPAWIEGYIAAGDVDVFWTHNRVLLDRGRGKVESIWSGGNGQLTRMRASFDGRYVWLAGWQPHQLPMLMVIDPEDARIWQLGADDGLPFVADASLPKNVVQQTVSAVGLSPGRACVAGYLGRSYVALVTFEATGPNSHLATVKIFHEAMEPPEAADSFQWRRTTAAFIPEYMLKLVHTTTDSRGAPIDERRILIGRTFAQGELWYHPLLVDPDRQTVSVIADKVDPGPESSFAVEDGAAYWAWSTRTNIGQSSTSPTLWRVGFPDFKKVAVAQHVYEGAAERFTVRLSANRSIVVGDHLWVADRKPGEPPHGPFRPLRGTMADSFIIIAPQLVQTNRYGTLIRGERDHWFTVNFLNGSTKAQTEPTSRPAQ